MLGVSLAVAAIVKDCMCIIPCVGAFIVDTNFQAIIRREVYYPLWIILLYPILTGNFYGCAGVVNVCVEVFHPIVHRAAIPEILDTDIVRCYCSGGR